MIYYSATDCEGVANNMLNELRLVLRNATQKNNLQPINWLRAEGYFGDMHRLNICNVHAN